MTTPAAAKRGISCDHLKKVVVITRNQLTADLKALDKAEKHLTAVEHQTPPNPKLIAAAKADVARLGEEVESTRGALSTAEEIFRERCGPE